MVSSPAGRRWFDAHLDLAWLAEVGRDMHVEPEEARGRLHPAAVTLPSLAEGGVRACLGTIFTESVVDSSSPGAETGAFAYPAGDAEAARGAGVRQLKLYHAWRDAGLISLLPGRVCSAGVAAQGSGDGEAPLAVGILVECADPIREPDALGWWVERGVIAIGLTWANGSRYAGGNAGGGGLTDLGRELIRGMEELGVVQDISHLSQRALDDVLDATDATVVATHSNCRALLGGDGAKGWQRHLPDEAIAEIARRGGVVGLNLCSNFLARMEGKPRRATIDECCAHIEHMCEVIGDRAHVGLGSDMDGGFSAAWLPRGIDRPADLEKLAEALGSRGWTEAEVEGFAWGNWARFWELEGAVAG